MSEKWTDRQTENALQRKEKGDDKKQTNKGKSENGLREKKREGKIT